MKFYEWDYNKNVVTQYERIGDCLQCGKCCKSTIIIRVSKPPIRKDSRNGGHGTDHTGIWSEVKKGRWSYCFSVQSIDFEKKATCPSLKKKGLCDCHDAKKNICSLWPYSLHCLSSFPECGYSFKEIAQWPIESQEKDA